MASASIFTFEPEPPRVASPWLQSRAQEHADVVDNNGAESLVASPFASRKNGDVTHAVTRLHAEPQQGPVEYKLHLLLRPRRVFKRTSTGNHISGSRHSNYGSTQSGRSVSESAVESTSSSGSATPSASSTQQTRQHRLEQLTTQLLWRLQQSSPHHTSSATNIILPSLPEALPELEAPHEPAKLLHGLEESEGALYEIGVSDDGTLVGLAEDELNESLNNLRAMAACLGCNVEVLRKEVVGDCEWIEDAIVGRKERKVRRTGKLVVAEALIKPWLQAKSPILPARECVPFGASSTSKPQALQTVQLATEQLRVTLTGPTMSGKSTLLGTLTTSTLDNGRGKSRLSMLRHRHEITSGVTSSVTQELLGYQDREDGDVQVVNYATENVASWIDIHVAASASRLVFISDSAGHPRYRRTTIRGLIGWAPHWTLLCVPADDVEDTVGKTGSTHASQQSLGPAVSDLDLSGAQLNLCLNLRLPLVIVITKLDLASRAGLKGSLSRVLDALKAAGRKPAILPNTTGAADESDLQNITASCLEGAYNAALPLLNNPFEIVPIVLTSAVQGTGIANLHALLHELPIPAEPDSPSDPYKTNNALFLIEDIYAKPAAEVDGVIISGRLRAGQLAIGDFCMLGPFGSDHLGPLEDSESDERPARRSASQLPASRSFPGALRDSLLSPPLFNLQEWRRVRITSIRNLRLPVHSLLTDQIGTIAIAPDSRHGNALPSTPLARIRKGMVMSTLQLQATRTFVAKFRREDLESLAIGNHVVVYIASVRASAKVVSARAPDSSDLPSRELHRESAGQDAFAFDDLAEALEDQPGTRAGAITAKSLLVTFNFDAGKEYVVVGDRVLVMPGGGPGLYGGHERGEKGVAGLEGFVGSITDVVG